jgi:2-polyprenyl-6-methoxyphenol hydroxylase-like FAD-dependent oxidoreductase
MKKIILFLALAAAPVAAQAQNMSVADFLRRSDALSAAHSRPDNPEYQRLALQLNESARLARNERRIARREHRAPRACLRPGQAATSHDQLFAHLRSIPAAQAQTTTVYQAYMQLMARNFPCRNG